MIFVLFFWKVYFEILNFEFFLFFKDSYWFTFGKGLIFVVHRQDFSPFIALQLHEQTQGNSRVALEFSPNGWPELRQLFVLFVFQSFLLKLSWFFAEEDKLLILELIFLKILSLNTNFLVIFSFILAWPKTRSFKEGWFELKFELPPCGWDWLFHPLLFC